MIAASVGRLVDFARRHAVAIALAGLTLSLGAGFYAATHLAIDTDIEHMLPTELAWRQNEIALDRAFPQNASLLAIVIDGQTGDLAERAARELAERMRAEPELFRYVRQPDGGPFFDQNGLLFLSLAELDALSEQLISAQPVIGSLAPDPSLRGLFDTLALFVKGAREGPGRNRSPQPDPVGDRRRRQRRAGGPVANRSPGGRCMTGRAPEPREIGAASYWRTRCSTSARSSPAREATAEIRRLAGELALDPRTRGARAHHRPGARSDDEQFATLREGALRSTIAFGRARSA